MKMMFNGAAQIAVATDEGTGSGTGDLGSDTQSAATANDGDASDRNGRPSEVEQFPLGVSENDVPPLIGAMLKFMGWYDLVVTSKRCHSNAWVVLSSVLHFISNCVGFPLGMGVIVYKIMGSAEVGAFLGICLAVMILFFWASNRYVVSSPLFHAVLRNEKARMCLVNDTRKQTILLTIQNIIIYVLVVAFLLIPMLSTVDDDGADLMLGPAATKIVLWYLIVGSFANLPYAAITTVFGMYMWFGIEHVTEDIIDAYIANVRTTMIDDDDAKTIVERIATMQAKADGWGRLKADTLSLLQGTGLAFFIVMTFAFLAMAGIFATNSDATVGGLAFLIFGSTFSYVLTVALLFLATMPNRAWTKAQRRVLNDFRLQPVIARVLPLPGQFHEWLDTHELSASRLFGVRVTTKGMAQLCSVLGSMVVIFAAIIVRSQILGGEMPL